MNTPSVLGNEFKIEEIVQSFSAQPTTEELLRAAECYKTFGCVCARGLLTPDQIGDVRRDIQQLISLRCNTAGVITTHPEGAGRFDDDFLSLVAKDRKHGSVIFDACRRLYPLHRLSVDDRLTTIARTLVNSELLIASDLKSLRIDIPNEDKYLHGWHQDYPYIMDSEDAVVCWVPLHDVNLSTGTVEVAIGSHQFGLQPLICLDQRNGGNNKQKLFQLADDRLVDQFPHLAIHASAGDVIIFSTMLLHRSLPNRSSHARWTAQFRFGNFAHPRAIERDWPGSYRDGHWFDEKHSEYIVG